MCFSNLLSKFQKPPPVEPPLPETLKPTSSLPISINDLSSVLYGLYPDAAIFLSDITYKLCALPDIKAFLAQDQTNRISYLPEDFDCDDFSYRLMGQFSVPDWSALAFGICWTDLHALNCCLDEQLNFWFIEPQQDKIQAQLEPWQGSTMRLIIM